MRQLPNWLWAALVLALIGIVVWGWAFDFSRSSSGRPAGPPPGRHYPVTVDSPAVFAASRLKSRVLRTEHAQLISPTRLAILTHGSSSCPSVPSALVVHNAGTLEINLVVGRWEGTTPVADPPPNGICTADYGTTQMLVAIDPALVDVHQQLTVQLVYPDKTRETALAPALPG